MHQPGPSLHEGSMRCILVGVDDICQLDTAVLGFLEMRQDSGLVLATTSIRQTLRADIL